MLLQEVCQAQKEEGNRGKSKMKYDYEEFGGTGWFTSPPSPGQM